MVCHGGNSGTWTDSIARLRYNQIAKADRLVKKLSKEKKRFDGLQLSNAGPFITYPDYAALVSEIDIDRDYQNISHSIIDMLAEDAGEVSWELVKGPVQEDYDNYDGISMFSWAKFVKKGWAKYHSNEDKYHPINNVTSLLKPDWVLQSDSLTFRQVALDSTTERGFVMPSLARFDLYPVTSIAALGQFNLPLVNSHEKQSYIFQNIVYMNSNYNLMLYLMFNSLIEEKKKTYFMYNNIYSPLEDNLVYGFFLSLIMPILRFLPDLKQTKKTTNIYKINRTQFIDNKWTPTFYYADRYNELIRDFESKALRDQLFTSTHAIIHILANYGSNLDQRSEIMREERACLEDRFQVDGAILPLDFGFEEDRYSPFLSEISSILENKFPLNFDIAETEKSRFGREYEYLIDGDSFFEQGEGYDDDPNILYVLMLVFVFLSAYDFLGSTYSLYHVIPLFLIGPFIGFFWRWLEDIFINQYQLLYGYSDSLHTPTDFDEEEEEDDLTDSNDEDEDYLDYYQNPMQEEQDEYDEFSHYDDIDEEDDLEDLNTDLHSNRLLQEELYEARQGTLEKEVKRRKYSKWNRDENIDQDEDRFHVWQMVENQTENYAGFYIEEGDNIGYIEEMYDQGETDEGVGEDYARDYFLENSKNYHEGPLTMPPFIDGFWMGKPYWLGMYMWVTLSHPYLDHGEEDLSDYNIQNWGDYDKDEDEDHEFDLEGGDEETSDVSYEVEDLDVDDDLQGYDDDPDTQVEFLYAGDIYDEDFEDLADVEFINDVLEDEYILPVSSRFSERVIYLLLDKFEKFFWL